MRHLSLLLLALLRLPTHAYADDPNAHAPDSAQTPPNILLIMLDDLGVNDLGISGNPDALTPSIDSLAAQGVHFTRHYAEPTCSVARASLMTSTFPAQHGMRPNHLGLSPDTATIASVLRAKGYHTQHIGKWHLAMATLQQSPTQAGFSDWFGFLHQMELQGESENGLDFAKPTYLNPWLRQNQSKPVQFQGHLTDILTDRAIEYVTNRQSKPEPWFLNLWFYAPHSPLEPDDSYAKQYPDSKAGRYRALIKQVDASIGKVLKALDESGQRNNTLVVLLSDNGATDKDTDSNSPYLGHKGDFFEGSLRTPLIMRWPDQLATGSSVDTHVTIHDIFPTIAAAAAADVPDTIVGRNLLAETIPPAPQLYWELFDSKGYSVLSADGRWRLSKAKYYPQQFLYDLDTEPEGRTDVASAHPDVVKQLTEDYIRWHKDMRQIGVNYAPFNDRGGAILTEQDLQRSPGMLDFTFAIGVTPKAGSGEAQVIARQARRWQLQLDRKNTLQLWILGQSFEGPTLPEGQCSELVVSTRYAFSMIYAHENRARISIFLDGQQVLYKEFKRPPAMHWGYANPTYIGAHSNGGYRFQGQLTKPIILNERLVAADQANALGLNDISTLPPICHQPAGVKHADN